VHRGREQSINAAQKRKVEETAWDFPSCQYIVAILLCSLPDRSADGSSENAGWDMDT